MIARAVAFAIGRTGLLFLLASMVLSADVLAAGYAIDFVGARSVGTATAGAASAADATTVFSNPAGIAHLTRREWIVGGDLFLLHDRFADQGSTLLGGALPTPGSNGGDAIPTVVVPWIFGTRKLTDQVSVGLGIFSPFGLKTDYGGDFLGRYQNELTSLKVIDLNPVVSYQPSSWLSLGVGLNVEYASLSLTQAIDFGSICTVTLGSGVCGPVFDLVPGRSDGHTRIDAHDVAAGFNAGVMMEPRPQSRFGIAFRSSVHHHFHSADQGFDVPAGARAFLLAGGMPMALTGGQVSTDLPLPARLSFAWQESVGDRLKLMTDATLTMWHVFGTTVVTPTNSITGAAVRIEQGYEDAWRFALGGDYAVNDQWSVRAGIAYDETPIPPHFIQAALPDRDRVYLSAGLTYAYPASNWQWDLGYSYVRYAGRIPIDRAGPTGDNLRGQFDVGGHVVAAQFRYRY